MGFLNDIVKVGSLGLVDDFDGSEGAAKSARAGNTAAMKAEREMFDENMAFQKESRDYDRQFSLEEQGYRRGFTEENQQYSRDQLAPYQQAGRQGLAGYQNLLNDPSQVTNDPGYQFRLGQGLESVSNSASAGGGVLSGNTLKGLTKYSQGFASNEYSNALNRQSTLANYGSAAATGGAGFNPSQSNFSGANTANTVGNIFQQQGTSLSNFHMNQGQIGAAESTANFNSMMGIANLGLSAYSMFSGGGGAGASGGGGGGAGAMQPISGYGRQNLGLF